VLSLSFVSLVLLSILVLETEIILYQKFGALLDLPVNDYEIRKVQKSQNQSQLFLSLMHIYNQFGFLQHLPPIYQLTLHNIALPSREQDARLILLVVLSQKISQENPHLEKMFLLITHLSKNIPFRQNSMSYTSCFFWNWRYRLWL
jgi:hypothetical protein